MDLDEWEIIPHDVFLELHEDGDQEYFPRTYVKEFDPSSSKSQKFVETTIQKQLVPLPIEFQPSFREAFDQEHIKEVIIQDSNEPNVITEEIKSPTALKVDQDFVPQVFLQQENDYVLGMKLEAPKTQIEKSKFQFEETTDDQNQTEKDREVHSANMWKWSLTGIGAMCSFGVAAAAAICIIILGNGQQQRKHQLNHQKLQFKIYADDKKINEVVNQTSRLNDAMSAARGIPIARAHITFGGYYDGF